MTYRDEFLADLRAVGVDVADPWDLVMRREPYPRAVPVLLKWLAEGPRDVTDWHVSRFREAIVRSLTMKDARGVAVPALIAEFDNPGASEHYLWAVGSALEVVAEQKDFDDLVRIAQTRRYGIGRQMVVYRLGRMKDPRAAAVLVGLLSDEDVAGMALRALKRLKPPGVRRDVESFLAHPNDDIRSLARKVLEKLPPEE